MFFCETSQISYDFEIASIKTKWDCINSGGEWVNADMNFDSTLDSYVSLLAISTVEGWENLMWNAVDTSEVD